MLRKSTFFRMFGDAYVLLIILYFCGIYYTFVYLNGIAVESKSVSNYVFLIWSHLLFAITGTAFVQTIISEPGRVPPYWGFFLDDPDEKRKRYCLICHIFKPERCHHCSVCNRCILNMDHHCPWLNNCIGFYNRKFFLLLLAYAVLFEVSVVGYFAPTFVRSLIAIIANKFEVPFVPVYLTTAMYISMVVLAIIKGLFLRFHIGLVLVNRTTIENLELKRKERTVLDYDIGAFHNFQQVFGRNPWHWFIPFQTFSGKPAGDGVTWPVLPSMAQVYEPYVEATNQKGEEEEEEDDGRTQFVVSTLPGGRGSEPASNSARKPEPERYTSKRGINISKLDLTSDSFLNKFQSFQMEERKVGSRDESRLYNESGSRFQRGDDLSSFL